jgi:hypothetical protein
MPDPFSRRIADRKNMMDRLLGRFAAAGGAAM